MATAASATAFSTAVRRVVVTPTFAAGLGVVIAAAMSYPMTRTVISYGGTPPAGEGACLVTGCGTGTPDGKGSPATASPGSHLASPAPAATRPDPSATAPPGGSGPVASGPQPVMQYQTLRQWQSGFIGQVTIAVPGGTPASWQLRLSYQSARIIGVWGGKWSLSGDHTVLVAPDGGDGPSQDGDSSIQVVLAVTGTPGPPSGCALSGRTCRADQPGEPSQQESPQQGGSHPDGSQVDSPDQGGPQQHGGF
jgi:Cellulose binding domain